MEFKLVIAILAVVISSIASSANALPVQSSSVNARVEFHPRAGSVRDTRSISGSPPPNRHRDSSVSGAETRTDHRSSASSRGGSSSISRHDSSPARELCSIGSKFEKRTKENCSTCNMRLAAVSRSSNMATEPLSDRNYWSSLESSVFQLAGESGTLGRFLGSGRNGAAYAIYGGLLNPSTLFWRANTTIHVGKWRGYPSRALKCVDDESMIERETGHLRIIGELYDTGVTTIITTAGGPATYAHCFVMFMHEGVTLKDYLQQPEIRGKCHSTLETLLGKIADKMIFYGEKGLLHQSPHERNVCDR